MQILSRQAAEQGAGATGVKQRINKALSLCQPGARAFMSGRSRVSQLLLCDSRHQKVQRNLLSQPQTTRREALSVSAAAAAANLDD